MGKLPDDGSGNNHANASDAAFAKAKMFMHLPDRVVGNGTEPFDVIVVDGPAGHKYGRGQSWYTAIRLAQSYGPDHHTHLFFHDATRPSSINMANKMLGHDASIYMGNTLPRKGLKHYRLPGIERSLPAREPLEE